MSNPDNLRIEPVRLDIYTTIIQICTCGKCDLPKIEELENMNIALFVLDDNDCYVPYRPK
jgi:hypothetical protein